MIALPWREDVAAKTEILLRWCVVLSIQGVSIWLVAVAYDAIDKSATRRAARVLPVLLPLWGMLVAGICIVLYEYQIVAWRASGATWKALAFAILCGMPSVLYGAARNYRTRSPSAGKGFRVHVPWMLLATAYLLIGYGVVAVSRTFLPDMPGPALLILSSMAAAFVAILALPLLIRRLFAKAQPIDWSNPRYQDTALLLDRLRYPRGQMRLVEARSGKLANAVASGIVPGGRRVVLTTDLVSLLTAPELAAVAAHEIGHHRRRHLQVAASLLLALTFLYAVGIAVLQNLATTLGMGPLGAFVVFSWMSAFVLLAMPAVLASCSRRFEWQADAYAARHGLAEELASAIEKIGSATVERRDGSRLERLLTFHPPWRSRVERLRSHRASA